MRHLSVLYYAAADKKVQHFERNLEESIPPKLLASQCRQLAACARVAGALRTYRSARWSRGKESFGWCWTAWASANCRTPRNTVMWDATPWDTSRNRAR